MLELPSSQAVARYIRDKLSLGFFITLNRIRRFDESELDSLHMILTAVSKINQNGGEVELTNRGLRKHEYQNKKENKNDET